MSTIPEQIDWTDNKENKQFEWRVDGRLAKIEYFIAPNGDYALTHTEVDPALEGRGIAGKLVKAVLDHITSIGGHVLPYCPYVHMFLKRHPEYSGIVRPVNN